MSYLTQLTYPDNKIVRYSYNANNQLAAVQDWANRVTIYTYDNNGRLKTTTRPDGSVETNTYNAEGQLTHTIDQNGNTIINEYSYTYDADGNITDEISANEPDVNEISVDDAAMSYSAANRLTNFNGTSIPYDADGNMLKTPLGNEFGNLTFDSLNQLTDVTISGSAISCSYTYDAEGYRTSKTENGTTTNFVVDPNAELSRVLMATTDGETTYYVYGLGLISEETGTTYRLYHYDYRGSTTAMTTLGGAVVDTMFYDAYGNMVKRTGADETPFLYVGKYGVETDANGLYYMRARYYNPQTQRFINVDPVSDGLNWYSYVECDPIMSIDPTGMINWSTQYDDFGRGIYARMEDFNNSVTKGIGDFIMDPKGQISNAFNSAYNGITDTITGIRNGDITLKSIASGAWDSGKQTAKSIGKGIYQYLPWTTISDEEAYMLGYNTEGVALDASKTVLELYAGYKVGGALKKFVTPHLQELSNILSPKFNQLKSKIAAALKDQHGYIQFGKYSDDFLANAAHEIHYAEYGNKWWGKVNPICVTESNGSVIVTKNNCVLGKKSIEKAKEIFGNDVIIPSGKGVQYQNNIWTNWKGSIINATELKHAEARGIQALMTNGLSVKGARQATTFRSCSSCTQLQLGFGIKNITG